MMGGVDDDLDRPIIEVIQEVVAETTPSDITAFVLARAEEKERAALSALSGTGDPDDVPAWRRGTRWHSDYERVIALRSNVPEENRERTLAARPGVDLRYELVATATVANPDVAFHIAANDPARVLREVAAVRAMVELHRPVVPVWGAVEPPPECLSCGSGDADSPGDPWPCPTLRLLASVDADHPDYRAEWAPA